MAMVRGVFVLLCGSTASTNFVKSTRATAISRHGDQVVCFKRLNNTENDAHKNGAHKQEHY